ncbi:MAG TPA: 2'-5' RNA ligase family protein [Polyangiales bacterium]|nr:2'-5' RNA ligase family protein [Polyangiales bacterium]
MPTLYGCALFPPPADAEPLARIRQRFDAEHASRSEPHITLKQPFHGPEPESVEESELVTLLRRSAAPFGPLQVHLRRIGTFRSPVHGSVVYARVEAEPVLHALARVVIAAVHDAGFETPSLSVEHETELYFPHLTLAQGLNEYAAQNMLAELANFAPRSFTVKRIGLGVCKADGRWQTPHTWSLS